MNLRKVGIIGCGMVGSATAFSLLNSGLFTDMVLIDVNRARAEGEAMDLSHCLPFIRPLDIIAGDYPDLKDCGIIIITAGVPQKDGETRLDCIHNNVRVFQSIIPQIVKYNKDAILLVVSNPVDVLSYVAYKLSGLPSSRVFGSGTVLDSARLKFGVGRWLNLDPRNIHAFVIGEHGDSELAVWSSANVSGIPLDDYCALHGYHHTNNRVQMENDVRSSAYEIIKRKGATYYGIAAATTKICKTIVRDEHSIMPVSTLINGHYGLDDVYISVPALMGSRGVEDIIDIPLSPIEQAKLLDSANTLKSVINELKI
ncbi:MAG: L-lactate dehydrogenase [Clostridiales bacterium]|nr:L-lactate dehydrogenase [Clostridiales bacterium]